MLCCFQLFKISLYEIEIFLWWFVQYPFTLFTLEDKKSGDGTKLVMLGTWIWTCELSEYGEDFLCVLPRHSPIGWGCRIRRLHLCRGERPLPPTSVLLMTLQFWGFGKCKILLHCHYIIYICKHVLLIRFLNEPELSGPGSNDNERVLYIP